MVNTRAKGNRLELRAQRILEADGWAVWRPTGRARHGSSDIFGAFDLLALHPGHLPLLVQVGVVPHAARKRRQVDAVDALTRASGVSQEVWCWCDKGRRFRTWRKSMSGSWREVMEES